MHKFLSVLGLTLLLNVPSAVAQEASDTVAAADVAPNWRVSGFGTLGLTYHEADNLQYRRSFEQPNGVKNNTLSTGIDTLAGIQVDGQLNSEFSVMAQAVTRPRAAGNWNPSLTWGFLKYVPNDDVEFRLGRLGMDIYLEGDSKHVGYSFTTVRPAPMIFGMLAFDTFDGGEVIFNGQLGEGTSRFKLYGGHTRGETAVLEYYKIPDARTLGVTYDWSTPELTVKFSWAQIDSPKDTTFNELASTLGYLGKMYGLTQASQRAAEIEDSSRLTFAGAGVAWEHGPWSLKGIVSYMKYEAFPDYDGWMSEYTAGYRIGKWKPYASYMRSIIKAKDRPLTLPAVPALQALATNYSNIINRLRDDEYTLAAGVRYDVTANAALKFQMDHVKAKRSSMLLDDDGLAVKNRQANVFTVTLDYIF